MLTAAPPAMQLREWLHLRCAGVGGRYVGTESGAPFLTWIRRSHVGCVPGRQLAALSQPFPLCPPATPVLPPLLLTPRGYDVYRQNVFLQVRLTACDSMERSACGF